MVKNCQMTERPPVIGLTGGIGSGKSAVANLLKANGCIVADADENSRKVLATEHVQQQLVAWWGQQVLDDAGEVDRSVIASIVFSDTKERKRLESLVHPLVGSLQEAAFASADSETSAFVIDAPLLMEVGLHETCDAVIFVDSDFKTRLKRVMTTRGWDEEQLRNREATQLGLDTKRTSADHIIINDGDLAHIEQQVRSVLSLIRNSIR